MTKDKALKLALEALELHLAHHEHGCVYLDPALAAIKEALAQTEQEPVAWIHRSTGALFDICPNDADENEFVPLYTTPPKREWVGLTEEQFVEAARLAEAGNYLVAFQRIQQWLKEKNA